MLHRRFALAFVCMLATAAGCGRTPEARTAYPCTVDLSQPCDVLLEQSDNLRRTYREELAKDAPDPARLDGIGACNRSVVEQEVTLKCVDDRCEALCSFHPCALAGAPDVAADLAACDARCDDVVDAEDISVATLDDALLRASARPGLCTCDVCDAATEALCTDLWACAD